MNKNAPLAERIRPKNLDEFVGQEKVVGENGIIGKLLENYDEDKFFPSIIFWGPPGSGKTTLARIIANNLDKEFHEFSAVSASTKDIERVINNRHSELVSESKQLEIPEQAHGETESDNKTFKKTPQKDHSQPIIFLDEIHRFNKAQQDKLLPHVEKGDIILIGATTENPSFEVISPLLSRTRVVTLKQLSEDELETILGKAVKKTKVKRVNKDAKKFLIESSNGDARILLNVLEIAAQLSPSTIVKLSDVEKALQSRQLGFDKKGEEHHNVISAYIKSMRASQPDAALYYLARMVEAGQDPLYIARRMVIFASEDIGMAVPTALVVANEVFRACETIGYPECAINLAHGTVYLAKAKKDRSSYEAYFKAVKDVKKHGNLSVPLKIRNAPTGLMKDLGYGEEYEKYDKESLLPEKLKGKRYYKQSENSE